MGALQAMSPRGRIVLAVSALGIVFVAFMLFRAGLGAELHDAAGRRRPGQDRQDHRRARPGRRLLQARRTTAPPSPSSPARSPRRASPSPARACRRRLAARLRAPRQAEARLLHLPAADRLPARPRGPDRPDHRADRRRLRRPGPAHAAQGRPLRRREAARHRGRAPQRRLDRARSRRGARHRLAGLLQRAEPQARQRHDHRRVGLDAVARRRRRRRRRRHGLQARGRGALRRGHAGHARRAASPARVGPDKAQVQVHADLNVDQATQEQLAVRQEGHAAADDQGDREPEGHRAAPPAAPPARPPTCPTYAQNAAGGGRQLQLQAHDRQRRRSASTRPSRARRSPRAPSTSSTSPCWSTSRSRPAQADRAEAGRRPPPPASTPSAATRMTQSTVVFAKPKAAAGPAGLPVPPAFVGPAEVRRASAWRASSSSSS